jgi:hypothetical protein
MRKGPRDSLASCSMARPAKPMDQLRYDKIARRGIDQLGGVPGPGELLGAPFRFQSQAATSAIGGKNSHPNVQSVRRAVNDIWRLPESTSSTKPARIRPTAPTTGAPRSHSTQVTATRLPDHFDSGRTFWSVTPRRNRDRRAGVGSALRIQTCSGSGRTTCRTCRPAGGRKES